MKHLRTPAIHATMLVFCFAIVSLHAADRDEKRPLLEISNNGADTTGRPVQHILGHIIVENNKLTATGLELTTVRDLPTYRQKLSLDTITTAIFRDNYLCYEGLYTIVRTLPQLTFLDVSGNKISELKDMPSHATLQTLLVHNNWIKEVPLHSLCSRLVALKQLALQDNLITPPTITDLDHTNLTIEELWFNTYAVDEATTHRIIQACPNLSAEMVPNSSVVQDYYSKMEQQYDQCNNYAKYSMIALSGAALGMLPAFVVAFATFPAGKPPEENFCNGNTLSECFGKYCAIFIPTCAIVAPLSIRIGARIYGWCKTDPQERYQRVYTRNIANQPQLLQFITPAAAVQMPDQEADNPTELLVYLDVNDISSAENSTHSFTDDDEPGQEQES